MTNQELALLEKLIQTNGNMIETLTILAESQYLIAQALSPMPIMGIVADDEPPTLQ